MNRRVLYCMLREMLASGHEAYTDGGAAAVVCPGLPMWVYLRDDMSGAEIRSFFYACLREIATPFDRVVVEEKGAEICAEVLERERGCGVAASGITAYWLPGGDAVEKCCHSERGEESPPPPDGFLREANADDGALVTEWLNAFYRETFNLELPSSLTQINRTKQTERFIAPLKTIQGEAPSSAVPPNPPGKLFIWQDARPVVMAMLCAPRDGMARVNLVYTPPAFRRRGYGAALMRAISKAARGGGNVPVLYTDAANTAANALYKSLGYAEAGRLTRLSTVPPYA